MQRGRHRGAVESYLTAWDFIHGNATEAGHVESAITSKGQATIPKRVRDRLGLKPGDRVRFFFHPDGSV
ncbi:MAG: AbrB/MazE/SpoVT family DNA-binding domain-containing protein, partial [Alphaproteobacteria bacterium]